MENEFKFSIIIPVYNSEQYLKRCLESVFIQSYKNFEIICVDDGSTDGSSDILKSYNDERLKIITQPNQGQGVARNKALDVVKGEYIYFLDSDDYIDETLLESMLETFETTDTDLVCFNTEVCGDSESFLFKRARRYAQLTLVGLLDFTQERKDMTNVYLWNKVFKTELVKKYGIRFPNLCYEDIAFCKTYFLVCDKVYYDMRRFHHYTVRENSLMDESFKHENIVLDHFRNWYEIFKMTVRNTELFMKSKDILEKWFWDYYFLTKPMMKSLGGELEELKNQYFEEFQGLI